MKKNDKKVAPGAGCGAPRCPLVREKENGGIDRKWLAARFGLSAEQAEAVALWIDGELVPGLLKEFTTSVARVVSRAVEPLVAALAMANRLAVKLQSVAFLKTLAILKNGGAR